MTQSGSIYTTTENEKRILCKATMDVLIKTLKGIYCTYCASGATAVVLLVSCRHSDINPHPSLTVVTKGTDKVVGAW